MLGSTTQPGAWSRTSKELAPLPVWTIHQPPVITTVGFLCRTLLTLGKWAESVTRPRVMLLTGLE